MPSSLQQTSYVSKHRRAAIQLRRLQVHQANLLVSERAIPPCVRSDQPRPLRQQTPFECFGFFGPETSLNDLPTIIRTDGSAPLILVHKPNPPSTKAEEERTAQLVLQERLRSEKSRVWLGQRNKREAADVAVLERRTLQVPPTQFTRKIRHAYAEDSNDRHERRLRLQLKPETTNKIDAERHFDALSDTESGTAETICDGVELSRGKELRTDTVTYQYVHRCFSSRHPTKASPIDFLAIIIAMLAGYVWTVFG